jgi:hypothetical protein
VVTLTIFFAATAGGTSAAISCALVDRFFPEPSAMKGPRAQHESGD